MPSNMGLPVWTPTQNPSAMSTSKLSSIYPSIDSPGSDLDSSMEELPHIFGSSNPDSAYGTTTNLALSAREHFTRQLQLDNAVLQSQLRQLEALVRLQRVQLKKVDREVDRLRMRANSDPTHFYYCHHRHHHPQRQQQATSSTIGARTYYEKKRADGEMLYGFDPAKNRLERGDSTRSLGSNSKSMKGQKRREKEFQERIRMSWEIMEENRRALREEYEEFRSMEEMEDDEEVTKMPSLRVRKREELEKKNRQKKEHLPACQNNEVGSTDENRKK